MNQYFGLINTIAKEFNILKGEHESEEKWKARIVYSYLGQVALASLFDSQEDLTPASIVHFKGKISNTLRSLILMYPELDGLFALDDDTLCDEIYNVYLNSGCIYHEPNRLKPCIRKEAVGKHIMLLRGQSVEEHRYLSGLGSYYINGKDSAAFSIAEMFLLETDALDKSWEKVIANSRFTEIPHGLSFEYLRITPPFNRGYWVDKPDVSGDVSIARAGMPGNMIYYLYRMQGSNMQVCQLPNWQTDNSQYRALAVGNLFVKKVLPETVYHVDGRIVTLRIGYLFPPAEMNLIKLYSWPLSYIDFPHDFSRIMDREVFDELRVFFEHRGYNFKEE